METASTQAERYSRGAIILHWLIAVLIVMNFIGAFVAEDMPKDQEAVVMGYHKANGILVLLLTVVRIAWRLIYRPPPLAETLKAWEAALARVTHWLFYLLMLAVPLAGWGMHSAWSKGKPVNIFGIVDMPALPVAHDRPTVGVFHDLHEVLALTMLGLLALHIAAALKHHFVDRDTTLRRIVPFMK
jgi:cytochrome b561